MPYPLDTACFVPLSQDCTGCRKQLINMADRVFRAGPPSLDTISKAPDDDFRTISIDTADDLSSQISSQDTHVFYLIPQHHSWGCLLISQEDLERLLSAHRICTPFLNVLEGFGSRTKESQYICSSFHHSGSSGSGSTVQDNSFEICYSAQYFENNARNRGDPWSLRKIGVYQRYAEKPDKATWIFLQLSKRIRPWFEAYLRSTHFLFDHPLMLHSLLLCALTATYPEYLQHLSVQLEDLDEKATFSSEPKRRKYDYKVSFADCQQLHLLRSKILRVSFIIDDSLQVASNFETLVGDFVLKNPHIPCEQLKTSIRSYTTQMTVYKRNVSHLLQRSASTTALLSKLLESRTSSSLRLINDTMQKNLCIIQQHTTDALHENTTVAKIAREGTKDSKKVQSLTFIATLYLPATLVATVFSSNLIQWKDSVDDSTTGQHSKAHYVVASEFWVYIVSTIVLLVVTLLSAKIAVKLGGRSWL